MLERTVKTTDALGNETNTTYDAMGRVSTVSGKIDGGDSVTAYTYDGNGNVIKESVTSNKPGETTAYRNTYYQYDSMNRLIKTNTDEPGETLYEYDDNGNVTKMTTGAVGGVGGVSTSYEYDSQNRLVKTTDPMGYTETYTYDNNGNAVTATDKNGTVTTNTYNALNSPVSSVSVKDTTTQTTTYTYGAASGALLGISDDNGSISYSYNKKGQQTGESRSTGETLTYTYDKDGNQTGMTMSANNGGISQNLSYTYNYLGQMTEVKDNAANEVIAAYTYDGNGNITEKKTNGNSMITEYEYNESGLIKTIENQTVADPLRNIKGTYSKYSYNYYLDGNQSDATDVFNKTKTYTYDGAGRLKTEGDGNDWITYYYDERGNRSIMHNTYGDEAIYYSYDANNRLKGTEINLLESGIIPMSILPVKEETTTYQYDKNGNVISMHREIYENPYIGDDEDYIYDITYLKDETYEYDLLNRLTSYSQTNHKEGESVSADYAYDPTGMRISKQLENENKINYVWSGGNVIGEYGIDGIKTYIRGAGGEIVKTKDGNSEERYFAYNGHGDTTSIIEKSAESVSFGVTATYEYDAFGNLIEGSETGETKENSFLYNGQQTDEESGLIYLRNRYYNPEIGRFITEDPYWNVNNMIYGEDGNNGVPSYASIAQSSNLYVYCMSEPVNFADPLGLTLTLIGSADEVWERYQSILLLTDDSLKLEQIGGADSNVYGVYILEYGVGERPVGTSLVRRIIKNEVYDCRIQTAYGDRRTRTESVDQNGAYMWYDENNVPHSSYGSDANIYIGELPTVPVDGGGYDIPEQMSLQITIGHEMIHALRMMNGNFKDPNYYINRNTGIPYEEYEVTGISYYDSNGNYVDCAYWVTTENALRREQRRIGQPGHLLRTGYTAW
ncbi:MAG TPA: hypothetical protein H9685_02245 [Firmicutes bacterium]|nr:hypothetical protein [Bacillota bacterium]